MRGDDNRRRCWRTGDRQDQLAPLFGQRERVRVFVRNQRRNHQLALLRFAAYGRSGDRRSGDRRSGDWRFGDWRSSIRRCGRPGLGDLERDLLDRGFALAVAGDQRRVGKFLLLDHLLGPLSVHRERRVERLGRHVDDLVAALLQLLEDFRQGMRRRVLDVVQKHDAVALFLQPRHDVFHDAFAGRQAMAVPAVDVGREHAEVAAEQILDVDLGVAQVGEAEERRDRMAQPGLQHGDALFHFVCGPPGRQLAQVGVRPGVSANGVARLVNLFENAGKAQRHLADVEKRRLGALLGERRQNLRRGAFEWAIVERQDDFLVAEEFQRMAVLQIADLHAACGVDFLHARNAQGVRVLAGVIGRCGEGAAAQHHGDDRKSKAAAHDGASQVNNPDPLIACSRTLRQGESP